MRRKLYLIFILLPALFFMACLLAGCWDKREPDELGIVIGAAIDFNPETGFYKILAELANPGGGGTSQDVGGGGGGGDKAPFWVVEAEGETVFNAIRTMELLSTRMLFWSHMETVVFSEEFARGGLRPALDFIEREVESRPTPHPFVAQGDIKKLLESEYPLEQLGGVVLRKQYTSIFSEGSVVPEVDSFRLLFQRLSRPGWELILPRAEVLEAGGDERSPSSQINPARISGAAVFRGDRLAGFFNDRETSGYLWITGNIKSASLTMKCPGNEEKLLTVSVTESSTRLEPEIEGSDIRFKLFIAAEGRIEDYGCEKLPMEEEYLSSLGRRMAETIRSEVEMALDKARELKADVFGMGNIIYRTKPKEWARLEGRWEELFPQIKVDIEIEALIERPGLVGEPLKIR
ncbi:MAG: Ger(x)C family spore germination protein [Dethiobacteria bacterium]